MIKVIPVIDVKNGISVSAIKGERDRYLPLKSVICGSHEPLKVAFAYKILGFSEVYVADLDGILYSRPDIELLRKINEFIPVIADAGVKSMEDVELIKNSGGIGVVIGTETLRSIDSLREILEVNEKDKNNNFNFNFNFILSLDVKNGRLLNNLNLDLSGFIEKIIEEGIENRIARLIILDLSQVGALEGPNIELCRTVMKRLDSGKSNKKINKKIIYGGGIRNISDVQALNDAGVYAVLVGTSLHTGKIKISDLKNTGIEL